jgi:hypothetical protein
LITWIGSTPIRAWGDLLAGHGQIDAAVVEADRFDRGGPPGAKDSEERLEGGLGALLPTQTTLPVSWSATMVRNLWPCLSEISSTPTR